MRIAIIGLGSMGRHHYNVIKCLESVELVAVVDQNEDNLVGITATTYSDVDEMLNNESPEIVVVATPTSTHLEISRKVLSRGINLLVEKPVSKNNAEAKEMMRLASKNDCKAVVGHIERYNPAIQAVLGRLRNEKIIHCTITRMSSYPRRITDVGVKLDLGIHDIDLLKLITQSNIETCISLSSSNKGPCEDTAIFAAKLFNGTIATVTTSWLSPFRERKIKIITEESYYEVDLLNLTVNIDTLTDVSGHIRESLQVPPGNALESQLRAFINYIETGTPGHLCELDDASIALSYVTKGE
jgi:UDP-N-acetylglucosamine 3-dehydrogenase